MGTRNAAIWDWPVRATHWSFAVLVPAMWYTAENSLWSWHLRLGHVLLALILFRLIWGVIGSDTARFSQFVKGPGAILGYLQGKAGPVLGHNPLGALSVLALLGALVVQVGTGLFSGDPYDGATGSLNALVKVGTADQLTELHETFFNVLLAIVVLHLSAIAFYGLVKRKNLIRPMVRGKGEVSEDIRANTGGTFKGALIALVASVAVAIWVWNGAPPLA